MREIYGFARESNRGRQLAGSVHELTPGDNRDVSSLSAANRRGKPQNKHYDFTIYDFTIFIWPSINGIVFFDQK